MEKIIAIMEFILRVWPLIKALLDAITDAEAKKAAEAKVAAVFSTMMTDALKA